MENIMNRVELHGIPTESPRFSHFGGGESFYTFPLDIARLSGATDRINIVAAESGVVSLGVTDFARRDLDVTGELRSFNSTRRPGSKLVITVLAKTLAFARGADRNYIALTGALRKPPVIRRTPLGSTICDLLLAVPRRAGRCDYLPCIAWNRTARLAAELSVGDSISLEGRIQSRKYMKTEGEISTERTAFEVSIRAILSPSESFRLSRPGP
ncbi:MAG: single-stranded DNA-binding protein [Oscillospiraceae bacterium]|nr:single-stranded DNA-binding protein [Oscillospiraceae bacterium]